MEEEKGVQFILGQILGEMKGLSAGMGGINTTFTAHALSDEKNFTASREQAARDKAQLEEAIAKLREQMVKDKEEVAAERARMNKYIGGGVVILTILSWVAPKLIDLAFN